MLVSGGKILALGKVSADNTLKGLGTPDSPLGINNPEQYAQKEWVENTFVSADYLKKNYWTSAETSAAVEARIHQIPGATEYSGGNGIKVDDYIISLQESAFNPVKSWVEEQQYLQEEDLGPYATKTDVSNASAAAVNSADGIIKYWVQHNYWTSGETQHVMEEMLADFGGYEFTQAGADGKPILPQGEDPSNKKIYLTENTSAVGLDRYFNWIYNTSTQDFICVGDTSVDLEGYAKTAWVSGELDKKVNSTDFNSYKTEVAQALADKLDKDEFDTYSAGIATALGSKLDKDDFDTWSANAFNEYAKTDDVDAKFSATSAWAKDAFQPKGNYVTDEEFGTYQTEVEQEFVNTSAWTKDTFVSANVFEEYKNTVADALAGKLDKSGFDTYSAGIDEDLGNISADLAKKLYTSATENWDVQEYTEGDYISIKNHKISFSADFVSPDELQSALDNYYKKNETWSSAAISNEFSSTSAWANDTFQHKGDYLTTNKADERYLPLSANLHNVIVTSQDESVTVTPASADGIVTYDLHVDPPAAEVKISGENGVSAEYDEAASAWLVGLTDYREKASWGQVTSDYTTYVSGSEKIIDLNAPTIVGDDIAISTGGDITLGEGLYHIDAQIDINVPAANIAASYYDVLFTIGNRSTIHELDASYAHAETVNLSFDIKVGASASPIAMYIAQLPVGAQYKVRNFNIHEVVTIDALIEGSEQQTYDAGVGIQKYIDPTTSNPTFSAKIGLGLSADANGFFNVACGSGLKIDAQGGVMAVTLDEVTEEVVNTVTELKGDLDTKVTVNFDYSNIDDSYNFDTVGSTTGQGVLLGYLFAVPINAKVYTDDDAASEYETLIGVYSKQQYTQNYVMFGLYEYDPSYPQWNQDHTEITGYGRTVPLCDTGAVKLKAGFNEFPVKHVNNKGETSPELKSSCLYYATLYVSKNPGGGIMLAGCPGYKTTFNTIPQITLDQANVNYDLNTMSPEERAAWSYNDMGWGSWGGTENYHELPSAPRFFMQVRNKKKDTTV